MNDGATTSPDGKTPEPAPENSQALPERTAAACPSYVEGFSVAPITAPEPTISGAVPPPAAPQISPPADNAPAIPEATAPAPAPAQASVSPTAAAPAAQATVAPASQPTSPAASGSPFAAPAPQTTAQPEVPVPSAWQPFTFRGVAAFAYASADRILLMQALMAFIAGISVLWFVDRNYSPVIVAAIRKMPEEAIIQNGNLENVGTAVLAERKFLSVAVDLREGNSVGQSADLQIELHKQRIAICPSFRSLAGVIAIPYPIRGYWPVGRNTLEPWWDAWKPMCYAGIVLGVALCLLIVWLFLATAYGIVVRLIAYFGDRALLLGQSWNLSAAALMPGALLMVIGIVCYGLQVLDLIGLSVLTALHLVVGWVYLIFSPLRARRLTHVTEPTPNPFG